MPKTYEDGGEVSEPTETLIGDEEPVIVPEWQATPEVVVRFWDHGVLYTWSLCGNYPDFPDRAAAELHVQAHKSA